MSVSDYIRYKKITTELKINKLKPVLNSQDYVNYKQYIMETPIENELEISNTVKIFDVNINPSCIYNIENGIVKHVNDFNLCGKTELRDNRIQLKEIYFTPKPIKPYVKNPLERKINCKNIDMKLRCFSPLI